MFNREGKPRCKILYRLFKEEYKYDPLLEISPFLTLIQLKYSIGWIHHCVKVVYKWIFDGNFPFEIHLTQYYLDYCCLNYNKTKLNNGYKVLPKAIMFFPTDKNTSYLQK